MYKEPKINISIKDKVIRAYMFSFVIFLILSFIIGYRMDLENKAQIIILPLVVSILYISASQIIFKPLLNMVMKKYKYNIYISKDFEDGIIRYTTYGKTVLYFKNGVLHNEFYPAVYSFELYEWWIEGKKLETEGLREKEILNMIKLKKKLGNF